MPEVSVSDEVAEYEGAKSWSRIENMTYASIDGPTVTTVRRYPETNTIRWWARYDADRSVEFVTDADIDVGDLFIAAEEAFAKAGENHNP